MRLKIDNFAKVKHADIVIDGITVIAGENNTGKSTIGKVLYSTFNCLYQIDSKIEERRRDTDNMQGIYRECSGTQYEQYKNAPFLRINQAGYFRKNHQ